MHAALVLSLLRTEGSGFEFPIFQRRESFLINFSILLRSLQHTLLLLLPLLLLLFIFFVLLTNFEFHLRFNCVHVSASEFPF